MRTVLLPGANRATVAELPEDVYRGLQLAYIDTFAEALPYVLAQRRRRDSSGAPAATLPPS